jgi:hypothetical protein
MVWKMSSRSLAWERCRRVSGCLSFKGHTEGYDFAPWKYVAFLDYATERIFLRKVGGGYIYIHRLLQDCFAELWEREHGGAE